MAERSVSVKLSARVESYIAAMKSAQAATAGVATSGARDLSRLGGQLQTFGRAATMGVTVPLVALGAGAVAMAAKFDTAFAQMVGLANVPASEVDGLKESVLALAGETAQAPQDLAEALYFAASAGLDSADAMDAVELAAKGAAAGMGSAQDIVGLVASAVASYGDANISAAEATDILTATIREGRAEPAELAATLGRVLPIASQMGITFAEVGGATAYLTNIMGGADISTTALRDALMKLSAPGTAAKTALTDMGTSFEELQASISEDGLLGALELLREHGFAGNAEALHALMPDAQGYLALTALLNDESGQLAGTIDAVTNSAGSLDFAFNAVSETSGFKMKQALTEIKVAMIQVGDILLPIAADVASSIAGLVGWFTDLNPAVQTLIVAFGGLMAAAGPLGSVAGTLLKNWTQLAGVFGVSESAATRSGKAIGALGLVVGGAVLAWKILGQGHLNASAHIDTASDALNTETIAAYDAAAAAGEATTSVDALAIAHLALSNAIAASADDELTESLARLNISADEVLDTFVSLREDSGGLASQTLLLNSALGTTAAQAADYFKLIRMGVDDHAVLADALGVSVEEYDAVAGALSTVSTYALENQGEINDLALAYLDAQVMLGGTAREAVLAAEAIAGNRIEANNAVPVYEEYIRQLTLLDPAAAQAALGADVLGTAVDDSSAKAIAAGDAIEGMADKTTYAGNAAKDLVGPLGGVSDAAALAGTSFEDAIGSVQGVVDALDKGGDAWRKSDEMFSNLGGAAGDAAGGFQELEDAVNDLWDAFDNIMNPADDLRSAARDVNVAIEAISDAMVDNVDASDDMAGGFDITTEAGRTAEEAYIAARDAIYEHGHQMMLNGATATEAAYDIEYNTRSLHDNMIAAGFTEEQIRNLNGEYFLTPSELKTQLETIGVAQAAAEIAHHKSNLNTIPRYQPTTVTVAVDENAIGKVNSRLANIVNQVRTAYIGVTGPGTKAGGGFNKYALGAYIPRPEFAMLHGNEAVLPLDNPPRMRELVADPRIGDPLMAALSGISEVGPRGSASLGNIAPAPNGMNGGVNTSVINVAVNMPPGSDGDDVVRALKQWQRRSGPLPLAVR